MAIHKLDKEDWRPWFDRVSQALIGKRTEIEVESLSLGSQVEAESLPLLGITYDPKDDIVEVALEDVDHLITMPKEIYVDYDGGGLKSVEIIDASDARHIVQLRDPLMLPAPARA